MHSLEKEKSCNKKENNDEKYSVIYNFENGVEHHIGFKTIADSTDKQIYCFDDIGLKAPGKYFGQKCRMGRSSFVAL